MKEQIYCKFRFICDRKWDDLQKIEGENQIRFCSACEKPVYLSTSYAQLAMNAAANRCVAVQNPSVTNDYLSNTDMLIGDVGPDAF